MIRQIRPVTARNPANTRRTMGTRMTGNEELGQRAPVHCNVVT